MTGTELKGMVKEAEAKRVKAREAYYDFTKISREASKAEEKVMSAKARFFASINKPMTARQISNLVGGAISKYSVASYFVMNVNKNRIGGCWNSAYLPNGKTLRRREIKGTRKYALLDESGNPTDTIIEKEYKYNVYWAE